MAQSVATQTFRRSFLDQFIDDNAENRGERVRSQADDVTAFRESVRRDLEMLLNCRQPCVTWPKWYDELKISLFNYGIPDFTGFDLAAPDRREEFRRTVEEVVRNFEPRLFGVSVSLLMVDDMTRSIRLRISAQIQPDIASAETIVFNSVVDTATRTFSVSGG
jgi:type VI secretion system protein ImpF